MVISLSYGPTFVLDMKGNRRHATLDDLNNLQKLNHMASSVHMGGSILEPVDVPVPHRHLHMAYGSVPTDARHSGSDRCRLPDRLGGVLRTS